MGRIVVQAFVTLDGVVQSSNEPGEPHMEHPNWTLDYDAEHGGEEGSELVRQWETTTDEALLLGRRTYDIWANAWGVWDEDAGGGTKLFGDGFPSARFDRAETRPLSNGVVVKTYRRAGAA